MFFQTRNGFGGLTGAKGTMGTIVSTIKVGQKPSKEEMKRIRAELKEAAKHPIVYTDDCPKSTPEALKEFAMQRVEMNRQKRRQTVTIRIQPDVLEKYKALGRGYSGIMADVLKLAADNPEILSKASTRI
jgi:uncharacterized protein (DUF4415 family)